MEPFDLDENVTMEQSQPNEANLWELERYQIKNLDPYRCVSFNYDLTFILSKRRDDPDVKPTVTEDEEKSKFRA